MKITRLNPPRQFDVGAPPQITLNDCGSIELDPDEQITFLTDKKDQYDIVKKEWGFYATPSLNGRLPSFSIKPFLVKNLDSGRFFILLLEKGKDSIFEEYCRKENIAVLAELDDQNDLSKIEDAFKTKK
jgi:hypothetical protein